MRVFDVIKNETNLLNDGLGEKGILAWKFSGEDFYDRSQLIVAESEEAVFFRDGVALQVFQGGRHTLDTANHPFLTPLRSKLSNGVNAFSCKVYFVNRDHKLELYWGTDSPIQVRDPVLRIQTAVQARGSYSIQVVDSKRFLVKLVGNNIQAFTENELNAYFRSAFMQEIKDAIADTLMESGREILTVANRKGEIAASLKEKLAPLLTDYGVALVGFYVSAIDIPDSEQRSKLEAAYGDAGVFDVLGENWARQRSAEILRDLANNPGAGGVAAAGAGLGMGMVAGGVYNDMAQQMFATPRNQQAVGDPTDSRASDSSQFLPVDEPARISCPSCRASIGTNAKYCGECGGLVRRSCPGCGVGAAPGAKFCSECGTTLLEGTS